MLGLYLVLCFLYFVFVLCSLYFVTRPNQVQSTKNKALNTKFPSQPQLQPIHLAVVSFMIVTGEMQQPMKDQLCDFFIQLQSVFLRLRCGSVDGNGYIAEV